MFGRIKKYLKKKLVRWLVSELFNTIDADDLISFTKDGKCVYRNRELTNKEVQIIVDEADRFHKSVIWRILSNEVKWKSNLKMFEKSMNEDDIIFGKASLWTLEVMNETMRRLSQTQK